MKIHTVQKGDTMWKIAKRYGVDFQALLRANSHIPDPDRIMPGMKVRIPTGQVPVRPRERDTSPGPGRPAKEVPVPPAPQVKEEPVKEPEAALPPVTPPPEKPARPPVTPPPEKPAHPPVMPAPEKPAHPPVMPAPEKPARPPIVPQMPMFPPPMPDCPPLPQLPAPPMPYMMPHCPPPYHMPSHPHHSPAVPCPPDSMYYGDPSHFFAPFSANQPGGMCDPSSSAAPPSAYFGSSTFDSSCQGPSAYGPSHDGRPSENAPCPFPYESSGPHGGWPHSFYPSPGMPTLPSTGGYPGHGSSGAPFHSPYMSSPMYPQSAMPFMPGRDVWPSWEKGHDESSSCS